MTHSISIPIDQLYSHPDNANHMSAALMKKLQRHIAENGDYPPLIVRLHPTHENAYEIIDGHHRLEILKKLNYEQARCDVWKADDQHAALLLLTLNRLHGDDDPLIRAKLLSKLHQSMDVKAMARRLPDDTKRIRRLLELTKPPPPPDITVSMTNQCDTPQAITFFLSQSNRRTLLRRLRQFAPDRNAALAMMLNLEADDD